MSTPNLKQITEKIIELLRTCEILENDVLDNLEISSQTSFTSDLNLDSLQALGFAGELENHYSVEISTELINEVDTVGETAQMVVNLLTAKCKNN